MTMQIIETRQQPGAVTVTHRKTLRRIPLHLLKQAYRELMSGRSEWLVCSILGISPGVMQGALKPSLEEALWERGLDVARSSRQRSI